MFSIGHIVATVADTTADVASADYMGEEPGGLQHEGPHQAARAAQAPAPKGPVDPETQQTDTAARVFRITNVRANAAGVAGASASGPTPVQALTSFVPPGGLHPVATTGETQATARIGVQARLENVSPTVQGSGSAKT